MTYQEYYQANKQKCIDRAKAWKRANREKVLAGQKAYRERNAARITAYNAATKEQQKARSKRWYQNNKERALARCKEVYDKNKDVILARNVEYKKANRDKLRREQRKYNNERLRTDPVFKLINLARRRMSNALKGVGVKSARTLELLGCDGETARSHLENKFAAGMSWANHGQWHIDHIRPLASFDLTKPQEQRAAFHYTNLQPLWAKENRSKAAKVV